LRGIGPAAASLILAVHDPENVVFFSDEAFAWLCPSKADKITYVLKEYEELYVAAKTLMDRLKVSPIDVEKVAFVIKREAAQKKKIQAPKDNSEETPKAVAPKTEGRGRGRPPKAAAPKVDSEKTSKAAAPKVEGRGRGRPPKADSEKKTPTAAAPKVEGRGRGRPPKRKAEDADDDAPKNGKKAKAGKN